MSRQYFGFYVNLDERGEFFADVRNSQHVSVFSVRIPSDDESMDLVDAGYMSHPKDIGGLTDYLREMSVIGPDDRVLTSSEFEQKTSKENPIAEDCLADFEANIGAAMWNGEGVFVGGGEFSSDELIEVHALLTAHNNGADSPFEGFSEEEKGRVNTFLANVKKAVSDREQVSIGGGEFNREDMLALKGFLETEASKIGESPTGPSA